MKQLKKSAIAAVVALCMGSLGLGGVSDAATLSLIQINRTAPGKQFLPIMAKGFSLTKGKLVGHIAGNSLLSASNSPLNDPYAPLVNGYDDYHYLNGDTFTSGSYSMLNGYTSAPGPVMMGPRHIYIVWYGNWRGNTAQTIIPRFIQSLNNSPYENIETSYKIGGVPMSGGITLNGQAFDNYSYGASITDADIEMIVKNQISKGSLPVDSNGIYVVLTSADVQETSGFCTSFCGWHSDGLMVGNTDIKYAFVGNGEACATTPGSWQGACIAMNSNYTAWNSPNNNPGADGMVSVIAHETEEAATDPEVSSFYTLGFIGWDWFADQSYENGDQCAWRFGGNSRSLFMTNNGSVANMSLGGANYLIQKNVVLVDPNGTSDYGINGVNWWNWYFGGAAAVGGTYDYCALSEPSAL